MFNVDNCIFVYNLYIGSENAANDAIGELEAAKLEISRAISAFNSNFMIDGIKADNGALTNIYNRIDKQISRIRRLIQLYNKCQNDMAKEAEDHGEGFL